MRASGMQRSMPAELARGGLAPARVKGLQRSMPVEYAWGGLAPARVKGLHTGDCDFFKFQMIDLQISYFNLLNL